MEPAEPAEPPLGGGDVDHRRSADPPAPPARRRRRGSARCAGGRELDGLANVAAQPPRNAAWLRNSASSSNGRPRPRGRGRAGLGVTVAARSTSSPTASATARPPTRLQLDDGAGLGHARHAGQVRVEPFVEAPRAPDARTCRSASPLTVAIARANSPRAEALIRCTAKPSATPMAMASAASHDADRMGAPLAPGSSTAEARG